MSTRENLLAAYANECQAYFRYLAFARIAENENQREIARLFRAVAEAEAIHAFRHFDVLGDAGDTRKNLMTSIDGEAYEFTQMYPAFIEHSESEGATRATMSFKNASGVEKVHNQLFSRALEKFGRNKDADYHICEICGNTVPGNPPDKCPVCGALINKFVIARD